MELINSMSNLYNQTAVNVKKTWLLITTFLVLVIFFGWVFSQAFNAPWILILAIIIACVQSFLSYQYSDKIVLRMTRAKPANKNDYPDLYRLVENLSITAGLPMPKIYIMEDSSPNAFATGKDPQRSIICVTTGLLQKLDKTELEGVISHELSHIGNKDILLSSVVVVLVSVISLLSDWYFRMFYFNSWFGDDNDNGGQVLTIIIGLVISIVAPLAAVLIQLAISRKREFLADASGAMLTRYPEGLARALEKIAQDPTPLKVSSSATRQLFIIDPEKNNKKQRKTPWFMTLWMTHPPLEERIKALRSMEIN